MPDAGVMATALLVLGLFLISLELMIPSFGLIGLTALISLVISAWCAWQAWWGTAPGFFWTYVGFWVMGLPVVFFGTFYLIQNTPLGGMIVLRGSGEQSGAASPKIGDHLKKLVGKTGRAVSPLTPGGMVEVDGERHHAETTGPLIESGSPVRVVDTDGTRLVVLTVTVAHSDPPDVSSKTASPRAKPPASPPVDSASAVDTTKQIGPTGLPEDSTASDSDLLDFDVPENYTAG